MNYTLLVAKHYNNLNAVALVIGALPAGSVIVTGASPGRDRWIEQAASAAGHPSAIRLDTLRNVVRDAEHILAFPYGDETADLLAYARELGKPITVYDVDGNIEGADEDGNSDN